MILIATTPAYAQTNTELLRNLDDTVQEVAGNMHALLAGVRTTLSEINAVLDDISRIIPVIEDNTETLDRIEATILGEACGEGTSPIQGVCVADITSCDADVVDGICMAAIHCGEGTLLHVDTCIADVSISYCGEGTVFEGGKCIAISPTADTPAAATPDTTTSPDRYVLTGDTIRVNMDGSDTIYTLAFADAPELDEDGGRDAVRYLDRLCGVSQQIRINEAPQNKAIISCGGLDVSHAMILAKHAKFNREDCAIREFVNIDWAHDRCTTPVDTPSVTTKPATSSQTASTPTPGKITLGGIEFDCTDTATPSTCKRADTTSTQPVKGTLGYKVFTFPVTVGDILLWETATDGDPMTVGTISCLFEHTPSKIDVITHDNTSGVYTIDTTPDYTKRHDGYVTMTAPKHVDLFQQKFIISAGEYVVFDRPADIIDIGKTTHNYKLALSIADWDTVQWSDTATPPIPTQTEKDQKILDVQLTILTDISNNSCTMEMAGVTPASQDEQTKLVSLRASQSGAVIRIIPHDVTCSERVTITEVEAYSTGEFVQRFDSIHITDQDTGDDKDMMITTRLSTINGGLSFMSNKFTVGLNGENPDVLAPAGTTPSLDGAALVAIKYNASSDDTCTWTERAS